MQICLLLVLVDFPAANESVKIKCSCEQGNVCFYESTV